MSLYCAKVEEGEILITPLDKKITELSTLIPGSSIDTLLSCLRLPDSVSSRQLISKILGADLRFDETSLSAPEILAPINAKSEQKTTEINRTTLDSQSRKNTATLMISRHAMDESSCKQVLEVINEGIREYCISSEKIDPADCGSTNSLIGELYRRNRVDWKIKCIYFSLKNIRDVLSHPRKPYLDCKERLVSSFQSLCEVFDLCLPLFNEDLYNAILVELSKEQQ